MSAAFLEAVRRIVTGFSNGSVVHEILVELGFGDDAVVVELGKLVDGDAVLLGERHENVGDCARTLR